MESNDTRPDHQLSAFALACWRVWAIGLIGLGLVIPADAEEPGSPRAGEGARFVWGADREGGGPYVFPSEADPEVIEGFEKDLAQALAEKLGEKPVFKQCAWDQLLQELKRGDVNVVLNGYEFSEERASEALPSFPYYIYELGLGVRREGSPVAGWDSLRQLGPQGRKWTIGVLQASAADRYVTDNFAGTVDIKRFEGSTECLRLVQSGQLDGTVQDLPILHFYIDHKRHYSQVRVVDKPVARGFYVMFLKANEPERMARLNQAVASLYREGTLRRIYSQYGIWNETQEELPEVWKSWDSSLRQARRGWWETVLAHVPMFLKAAVTTILLAVLSMPLAVAMGLGIALVRTWNDRTVSPGASPHSTLAAVLAWPCALYVELVRGTPLAFQLFLVYFVLPDLGLSISAFWAGVIALAINYSAYEAEIFRLGLQAIPRGQLEASLSLGMTRGLAIRRIVLPQALRIVIPATANDFIALFKDTAVCSVIAVEEVSKTYSVAAKSTNQFLAMAVVASLLYLAMSYPLSLASQWIESRLRSQGPK